MNTIHIASLTFLKLYIDFYTDVNFPFIITKNFCFMSFNISKKKE